MPPAITKKIELTITSTGDTNSPIPALLVAEKFQSLQNLLYVVGDFLEGNKYRTSGDFPKSVKERFTLVVRELKIGSVGATLGIADSQQGLFPQIPTNGEKAIDLTNEIVHIAQSDDDISKKISRKNNQMSREHTVSFRRSIISGRIIVLPSASSLVLASPGPSNSTLHANPLSSGHSIKCQRQLKKQLSAV